MTNSRKKLFFGALILCFSSALYLTQCRQKPNETNTPPQTTTETAPTQTTPAPTTTEVVKPTQTPAKTEGVAQPDYAVKGSTTPIDTLFVAIDSEGVSYLGDKKMDTDLLRRRLIDSLQTLKKQTGQYPKKIKLKMRGDVLMGIRGEIQDVIQEAKDTLKIK